MKEPIDQSEAMDRLLKAGMHPSQEKPITDDEKCIRDALVFGTGFTLGGKHVKHSDVFVVPADVPMVPGRKLRDALLEAGYVGGTVITHNPDFSNTGMVVEYSEMQRRANKRFSSALDQLDSDPKPRRSFIRTVGSIAWRLFIVMVVVGATVIVLAGVRT